MLPLLATAATLVVHALAAPTTADPTADSTASHGHGSSFKYSLPPLSGQYCVGKTPTVVLTDPVNKDIFADNNTSAPREILVTMYYPTDRASSEEQCLGGAYADAGFAGWISTYLNGNVSVDYFQQFQTHSVSGAKFYKDGSKKKTPLLLYSHGFGVPLKLNQAIIEDVTSHGYIIAAMEHPWDSDYAEFPDGHVVRTGQIFFTDPDYITESIKEVKQRVNDTFLTMNSIKNKKVTVPGCDISQLTKGCGMFGHSVGGQLSLVAMLQTPDIAAGVNMDGWFWNGANATNLTNPHDANCHRPYMTLRSDPDLLTDFYLTNGGGQQNYVDAMKVQSGPKVMPFVKNYLHWGWTDLTVLSIPAWDNHATMAKELSSFQTWTGPGDPRVKFNASQAYNSWFFDNTINGGNANIAKGIPGIPGVTLATDIGN